MIRNFIRIVVFFFLGTAAILGQEDLEADRDSITNSSLKVQRLSEVEVQASTILGSKFQARNRTGSASYISQQDLDKFGYTDINRVLKQVPGVAIYEEEGFGLRPNISLRGTSPYRSSKITLMEDGVLIGPAPYSAPEAYYFPTVGRMQAIEVLKGSSQIQYGPFTTGGAINMVSRQIPDTLSGRFLITAGNYDSRSIEATVGDSYQRVGYVMEYFNYNSDGFKSLEGIKNTGFDKSDYLAKVGLNSPADANIAQSLILKLQFSEERSNETYLGLTDEDFELDPYTRYAASQRDLMTADHSQFQLTHSIRFNSSLNITTTAYKNRFKRNWYKLDYVNLGDKISISDVVSDPETYQTEYRSLLGDEDTPNDALGVKANNRKYAAQGIETIASLRWGTSYNHYLEFGLRYHEDEEDRFQWVDGYGITDGQMNRTSVGVPGMDANRIASADAIAAHLLYKVVWGAWTLTPGLRYENITQQRIDYGKNDTSRTGSELQKRENSVDVWIPGIGIHYNWNTYMSLFGGIHKGFAPPGSQEGQDPEESINMELGARWQWAGFSGELIGYWNEYQNLLGSDQSATGGSGTLDQFNAGEARVNGVEVLLNYDILYGNKKAWSMPVVIGYTWTNTRFLNDFQSDDEIWETVVSGDQFPYISPHQINLGVGLEHGRWALNLNARYSSAFRTQAGRGDIPEDQKIDANFIMDLSTRYRLWKHLSATAFIINLLDTEYEVSRAPAGLRPGHPFGFRVGLEYIF